MITVTLKLSAGLLCILEDAGIAKAETIVLQAQKGISIKRILAEQGINPLLVPMVAVDHRKTDITTVLEKDSELTLYGPLAGG